MELDFDAGCDHPDHVLLHAIAKEVWEYITQDVRVESLSDEDKKTFVLEVLNVIAFVSIKHDATKWYLEEMGYHDN